MKKKRVLWADARARAHVVQSTAVDLKIADLSRGEDKDIRIQMTARDVFRFTFPLPRGNVVLLFRL